MHRRVGFDIKKHKIKCDIIRYNLPLVARSSNLIAWIERANFFIFKMQQSSWCFEKWRSCVVITPRFSSFLLFSRQNVDFSLCLSIVIGCVVRTNPRTQSLLSTYRRGGYRVVQWVGSVYRWGSYRGAVGRK